MEIIRTEDETGGQKGYLALPFDGGQFTSFITGLLGKPQTLTKTYHGKFELYLSDIQNFHQLIHQRITQQNHGHLIQMTTTIYFNDDSSVTLGSYEELITYNEVNRLFTEGVRISWIYLLQFADKDVPEKQEIEIYINSGNYASSKEVEKKMLRSGASYSKNSITVIISHTARSWGFDMVQLLSSNIKNLFQKEKKLAQWITDHSETIGVIGGLVFLIGSFSGIYFVSSSFIEERMSSAQKYLDVENTSVIEKINFLIESNASQGFFELKTIIYVAISMILSIIVMAYMIKFTSLYTYSYIVLTKADNDTLQYRKKREIQQYIYLGLTVLAGVLLNILSSFIYDYFT